MNNNLYPEDAYTKIEHNSTPNFNIEKLMPFIKGDVSPNEIIKLFAGNNPKLLQMLSLMQNKNILKNTKKITAKTCDYISVKDYYSKD